MLIKSTFRSFITEHFIEFRDKAVNVVRNTLVSGQQWDDYQELQLILICLEKENVTNMPLKKPVSHKKARWMARPIYNDKTGNKKS